MKSSLCPELFQNEAIGEENILQLLKYANRKINYSKIILKNKIYGISLQRNLIECNKR